MLRIVGVLILVALPGCCFLCIKVNLSYELQVRSLDGPVAGAAVTLDGIEGLHGGSAVTDENGRCEFSFKEVRKLMDKAGSVGPGFQISIQHKDFVPLRYLVMSKDLIRDGSDYSRSEAVELRRFHFTLECDPADQAAAAEPLRDLLAKEDLKARIFPVALATWRYREGVALAVPPDDSLAIVLLITPGLLAKSPEVLLHLGDSKGRAGRATLIPVILGAVSDERRAAIQSNSRLSAHSIAGYDGQSPLTAEQLKGLLETLRRLAANPQR